MPAIGLNIIIGLLAEALAAGGADVGIIGIQQFFASPSTYTPSVGAKSFLAIACAAGGGGAGIGATAAPSNATASSGGGGAGELRAGVFQIGSVASFSVTIGSPGSAGSAGANAGGDAGDLTLNDGTNNILVCKGGKGGVASAGGAPSGAAGANGSGGSGGIPLSNLLGLARGMVYGISSGQLPVLAGNSLFSVPPLVVHPIKVSAGAPVLLTGANGSTPGGKGTGGGGAWHGNGETGTFAGAPGSGGYMLIFEFD